MFGVSVSSLGSYAKFKERCTCSKFFKNILYFGVFGNFSIPEQYREVPELSDDHTTWSSEPPEVLRSLLKQTGIRAAQLCAGFRKKALTFAGAEPVLLSLVESCLKFSPEQRPSFAQISELLRGIERHTGVQKKHVWPFSAAVDKILDFSELDANPLDIIGRCSLGVIYKGMGLTLGMHHGSGWRGIWGKGARRECEGRGRGLVEGGARAETLGILLYL
jgi:hypothetical protein